MKGIVFKEFLSLVEDKFGYEVVDKIITESNLSTDGAYTTIGTYDHSEILKMVTRLSHHTNIPVPALVKTFGGYLLTQFVKGHPSFFADKSNSFDFLKTVDNYIHVEVKKLYPEAELPEFKFQEPNDKTLIMTYQSKRPFADLAEGLIEATVDYYKDPVTVAAKDLSEGAGTAREFTLTRQ